MGLYKASTGGIPPSFLHPPFYTKLIYRPPGELGQKAGEAGKPSKVITCLEHPSFSETNLAEEHNGHIICQATQKAPIQTASKNGNPPMIKIQVI